MTLGTDLLQREIKNLDPATFRNTYQVTRGFIDRLGLKHQLHGHEGCVNCIQWSENGELLASGSDDVKVIVWDPFAGKKLQEITTGHEGNIFSVKFMPDTANNLIVSGAADYKLQLHDMTARKTVQTYKKHIYRVKRCEVSSGCPNIFWSASEDGTIMETDIRAPPEEVGILINLAADAGSGIEAKCLSINPVFNEYLVIGASDPYLRMYDRRKLKYNVIKWPESDEFQTSREKKSYLKTQACQDYDWTNQRFAKYFVAGHLPTQKRSQRVPWRRDNFTSTYATFSSNGRELLANMGSEQIYLFDVFHGTPILLDSLNFKNFTSKCDPIPEDHPKNGFHSGSKENDTNTIPMPLEALDLKLKANHEYESEKYSNAIDIYNQALSICTHPILLSNRAAALIKRNWNGDVYSALLDSYRVITDMDPTHIKAHLRLIKCLIELKWLEDAVQFIMRFKIQFQKHSDSQALKTLEKRLQEVESELKEAEEKHKRFNRFEPSSSPNGDDSSDDNNADQDKRNGKKPKREETPFDLEIARLKSTATDFKLRFCGHCNTTTDIKEANFFGRDGKYIIAGSDDGKFFIWDRQTTNIIKVLQGDDSIVNCLQPHPTTCLLATSGIDPYVRIWSPRPEDADNEHSVTDFEKTTSANQRRMNADPFESFLMDMGYRVRDMGGDSSENDNDNNNDDDDDSGRSNAYNPVQCAPS